MFTKSVNRVLFVSGLTLATAIGFSSAAFAQATMQGSASNQVTGQLNPFASISWPQPNAFGIAAQQTAPVVQYVTLSTNVEYDANVPWQIKAQSLNSSMLINSSETLATKNSIGYRFALGVGSSTGGDTTGMTASDGSYKTLVNTAEGGAIIVSGNPGQGQLVPKLELTIQANADAATVLTPGAFSDTITLFMFTQ